MKLGVLALQAEQSELAFECYSFVPDTSAVENDLKALKTVFADFAGPIPDGSTIYQKQKFETQLQKNQERIKGGQTPEVTTLASTAYLHEQAGNPHGAYAAYKLLEQRYSKAPAEHREDNLYHLARTASRVGRPLETEEYGQKYFRLFPGGKHEKPLQSIMLQSLFYSGNYDDALRVASDLEPKLKESAPNDQHDIALHVLGGCLFYKGRFNEARGPLERHKKEYPESKSKIAAQYLEASNWSQLQIWDKAGPLLDKFLADYPDAEGNSHLPLALFDRANVHFANEEYDEALVHLDRLEAEFREAGNRELVFLLKGNIFQNQDLLEDSILYYERAIKLADTRGNTLAAGDAVNYLISIYGDPKKKDQHPKAIELYDLFWEKYSAGSPFQPQVAVAGMDALETANRFEDGLTKLEEVIVALTRTPNAYFLEEAIGSYTKFFLKKKTPEELKDKYYSFNIDRKDKGAQALLRIALIGVFEGLIKEAKGQETPDEDELRRSNALVKVLFDDLKNDFDLKDLTNGILVRLGDYIRTRTANPRAALPYYEEITQREDKDQRFAALFGIADILGQSDNPADLEKASKTLAQVFEKSEKKKEKEQALYRIVEVFAKLEDWKSAKEKAKEYLAPKANYNAYAHFVSLLLGRAYENLKETENAIATYGNVTAAYTGFLAVSAPAMKSYMQLLWTRNRPANERHASDRQLAYNIGRKYIFEQTSHIREREDVPAEEKALWDEVKALVEQYEANSAVKAFVPKKDQ